MTRRIGVFLKWGFITFFGLFLVIQLVPYGRDHQDPPVAREPNWNSPETRALAQRACFDCHSNETVWPWYSDIAPVSWLVQSDVDEGREHVNFSDWGSGRHGEKTKELVEEIRDGAMPPNEYLLLHPKARLTKAEREQLISGLIATTGGGQTSSVRSTEGEEGEDEKMPE